MNSTGGPPGATLSSRMFSVRLYDDTNSKLKWYAGETRPSSGSSVSSVTGDPATTSSLPSMNVRFPAGTSRTAPTRQTRLQR